MTKNCPLDFGVVGEGVSILDQFCVGEGDRNGFVICVWIWCILYD